MLSSLASRASVITRTATTRFVPAAGTQVRHLNVHEYIGIETMAKYNIPTPASVACSTPEEAERAYMALKTGAAKNDAVIKAQALCGGRGKGHFKSGFQGGVHMVTRPGQAKTLAAKMLGGVLVTKQTGEAGLPVNKVMVMERMYMRRELYFSILMDRANNGPVMVASTQGGTSIEDVARDTPEAIFTEAIDIMKGPTEAQIAGLVTKLGFDEGAPVHAEAQRVLTNLYHLFIGTDATLVEINPMAETPDGRVVVCDAKLNFDDNAAFRQKEIHSKRDLTQEDPREVEAHKYDLNYIGLDGNIGCLVNGAGLAMATMDIIKLYGGAPANFLDVGGGASAEQVQKAFEILNGDPAVKAILVNIFGGIMRCDVIAHGVINAAANIGMRKPIVIRLQGTNVNEAKALIEASGYRMILADNLDDAASKAVKIADIVKQAEEVHIGVNFEIPL